MSYGALLPGTREWSAASAARNQVARAGLSQRLTDYRQAEDASLFMAVADSAGLARFHITYWTAVAARLLQSRALAARAAALYTWAMAAASPPGAFRVFRGGDEHIASIYRDGMQPIMQAGTSPQVQAVLAVMAQGTAKGRIAASKSVQDDRSLTGQAGGAIRKGLVDLVVPDPSKLPTGFKIALGTGFGALVVLMGLSLTRKQARKRR